MCLNVFCDLCIKWSTVIGYPRGSSGPISFAGKILELILLKNKEK